MLIFVSTSAVFTKILDQNGIWKCGQMATPGLPKIKVFWKKGYDVIIFVSDVNNKILARDSTYIVDVVTWPKFGNSNISMREVIITSSL